MPCLENSGNKGGLGLKLFTECLAEAILKGSDLTASTETEGDRIVEYCLPVCTRRTSEGLGSDLCFKKQSQWQFFFVTPPRKFDPRTCSYGFQ